MNEIGGLPLPKVGAPAARALAGAGYVRLEQFTDVTEAQLARLHGVGPLAINRIRDALAGNGLGFAPD